MGKRLHSSLTVIYANESSNLLGLREDTVLFLSVSLTLTKAMAKKKKMGFKTGYLCSVRTPTQIFRYQIITSPIFIFLIYKNGPNNNAHLKKLLRLNASIHVKLLAHA